MIILPLHSIIGNYFHGGYHFGDQTVQFVLLGIQFIVVILNRKDEWIHKSLAILFLLICVITFVVAGNTFLITG